MLGNVKSLDAYVSDLSDDGLLFLRENPQAITINEIWWRLIRNLVDNETEKRIPK